MHHPFHHGLHCAIHSERHKKKNYDEIEASNIKTIINLSPH